MIVIIIITIIIISPTSPYLGYFQSKQFGLAHREGDDDDDDDDDEEVSLFSQHLFE